MFDHTEPRSMYGTFCLYTALKSHMIQNSKMATEQELIVSDNHHPLTSTTQDKLPYLQEPQ